MHALLTPIIIGEFGGRTVANPHYAQRICQPGDYAELRKAAKDDKTLIAFWQRCRLLEFSVDRTHVHETAYLPPGHCEGIKQALERILAEHAHGSTDPQIGLPIEHKEMRHGLPWLDRLFAHGARLRVACREDGSIRMSAPQRWEKPAMYGQPLSLEVAQSIVKSSRLLGLAILFGALAGLLASTWKWVLLGAAIPVTFELLVDGLWYWLLGSAGFAPLPYYGVLVTANAVGYFFWATLFHSAKRLILQIRAVRAFRTLMARGWESHGRVAVARATGWRPQTPDPPDNDRSQTKPS